MYHHYFTIIADSFRGIFELSLVLNKDDNVNFKYSLYQVYENDNMVGLKSLNENPKNKSVFDNIDKKLLISNEIDYNTVTDLLLNLDNIELSQQYHQIQLPRLKICLTNKQLIQFKGFLRQYIDYYDIIKTELIKNKNEDNKKNNEKIIINDKCLNANNDVVDESENENVIDNLIDNNNENENSPHLINNNDIILKDIIKLSPNNFTNLFITKLINLEYENRFNGKSIDEIIDNKNNDILIPGFISDNHILKNGLIYELGQNLLSFNYANEEYISKLKLVCKELLYIINNKNSLFNDNDHDSLNYLVIILKCLNLLIFIYTFKKLENDGKVNIKGLVSGAKFLRSPGEAINNLVNKTLNYMKIDIKFVESKTKYASNNLPMNENVFNAIQQYKYLIDIDKETFISHILNLDYPQSKHQMLKDYYVDKPSVINIEDFISNNEQDNTNLSYSLIDTTNTEFHNNKVISKYYYQTLKLMNLPHLIINDQNQLLKNFNPILLKYHSIITENIFKDLSMENFHDNYISTLYLIDNFIRSYISHELLSGKITMFILYKILIPYIYDFFGQKYVIDYYH
jgi:hypothetical protein